MNETDQILVLRVRGWREYFEANREKDRPASGMHWVRIPVDPQSSGYRELMQDPEGIQHLGAFLVIVQVVASLPRQARDGRLCNANGEALSLKALALKTRADPANLAASITQLRKVGWLEDDTPDFDPTPYWRELLEAYPTQGRKDLVSAEREYRELLLSTPSDRDALHRSIVASIPEKWAESKHWADGYICSIGKFIREKKWLETPEASCTAPW